MANTVRVQVPFFPRLDLIWYHRKVTMFLIMYNLNDFFVFVSFIALVAILLLVLPELLSPTNDEAVEKLSAYECGFAPFSVQREVFESHFVVVAVLFLIFDLELVFLLPWAGCGNMGGLFSFFSVFSFLFLLVLGLAYEWFRGGFS